MGLIVKDVCNVYHVYVSVVVEAANRLPYLEQARRQLHIGRAPDSQNKHVFQINTLITRCDLANVYIALYVQYMFQLLRYSRIILNILTKEAKIFFYKT